MLQHMQHGAVCVAIPLQFLNRKRKRRQYGVIHRYQSFDGGAILWPLASRTINQSVDRKVRKMLEKTLESGKVSNLRGKVRFHHATDLCRLRLHRTQRPEMSRLW